MLIGRKVYWIEDSLSQICENYADRFKVIYVNITKFVFLIFLLSINVSAYSEPLKVSVEKQRGKYQLLVNGQPFLVKGVGLDSSQGDNYQALVEAGGNAFRTWSPANLEAELEAASKYGLKVAVGLGLKKQLQGFDYNDKQAVAKQYAEIIAVVDKYKDHPAVLMWVIANEPNLLVDENEKLVPVDPQIYQAINDIIEYIHRTDPNHPVTFTFAGADKQHVATAMKYASDVDIVSLQVYGDLGKVSEMIDDLALDKPFMVTEYGPTGHWESPKTSWGREIEEPGAVKADTMLKRMNTSLKSNPSGKLVGDFSFLWGSKQERTPTWYGMVNPDGKLNARADAMSFYWTGKHPQNRAPRVTAITMNGMHPQDSVTLKAGAHGIVEVMVTDPDQDALSTRWIMSGEVGQKSQGGFFEAKPDEFPLVIHSNQKEKGKVSMSFTAPDKPGEYRIFAYVYDDKGKVGNANIPFLVK